MRTIAWIFIAAWLWTTNAALADDTTDVQAAFSGYRAAILAGEGKTAIEYLSNSTFEYYDQMRSVALDGDRAAVQGLSLINQMQVLMLRLRVPMERLVSMTPRELVAHAVDAGWIGKNSVLATQPGRVLVEKDLAVLHPLVNGQEAAHVFRFYRESGRWRLDLISTIQQANAALQLAAKQAGIKDSEFILALLESALGQKIGPEAWDPLRKAP